MPRWEFVVGKFLGLVLTIAVNIGFMTAALYLLLAWMGWTLSFLSAVCSFLSSVPDDLWTFLVLRRGVPLPL